MDDHKIRAMAALLILLALTAGGLWPAFAQQAVPAGTSPVSTEDYKAGEILVKFKEGVSTLSAERTLQRYDATYDRTLYGSEVEVWQVPVGSELDTVEQLNAAPRIEYAEPNYRVYALDNVPNDPNYSKQWGHPIIESPAAWDITTGNVAVTIAILDSGVDLAHPDLAGKIVAGYDFVDNDTTAFDLNGHGTHVAGIASAITNNGVGVAGMDWNARIMPIRVVDDEGRGYVSVLVEGIRWAYSHGAKVLNLSLGYDLPSESVQNAINAAHAAGSLIVAAMGNIGEDEAVSEYPAKCDNVLAVAATGPSDARAYYSYYGDHCDVAAPGGAMSFLHDPKGIYSTMPRYPVYMTNDPNDPYRQYYTNYDYVQGTSQAAPYVSGLAALVWAVVPSLTPDEVEFYIETTAVDKGTPGWDKYYGYGRIDALAALRALVPGTPILAPIGNSNGDSSYTLDWNEVPRATKYELEEDDSPSFTLPTRRFSLLNSQFQITGQQGGTWYYRVRANNASGSSSWSNLESVTVRPGAPSLFLDQAGTEDEYQLTWSAPGASGYTLEEDENALFSSPVIRYKGAALGYSLTGQPNGTWHYRVQAYNAAGAGPWSNSQSTTVSVAALLSPELAPIENSDGNGEFVVGWTEVTSATNYLLQDSRDPYFATPTDVFSGTVTETLVVDQPGGTWHYRVRAFGDGAKSPWSDPQSVLVPVWVYLPLVARD